MTITLLWKENEGNIPDAVYLKQCHGIKIYKNPSQYNLEGDGILTKKWESSYAIKIADCLGIVLVWKEFYCAIHVGWRGLYQWLIHHAVKKMCRHGECIMDMNIWMSPSLKYLEVWKNWDDFTTIIPQAFLKKNAFGLYEIDIVSRASSHLAFHGITQEKIQVHPDCTFKNSDKWFSYRKEWTQLRNWIVVT